MQVINMCNLCLYLVAIYSVVVLVFKFITIIIIPWLRCSGHSSYSDLLMLPGMCPPSEVRDKSF